MEQMLWIDVNAKQTKNATCCILSANTSAHIVRLRKTTDPFITHSIPTRGFQIFYISFGAGFSFFSPFNSFVYLKHRRWRGEFAHIAGQKCQNESKNIYTMAVPIYLCEWVRVCVCECVSMGEHMVFTDLWICSYSPLLLPHINFFCVYALQGITILWTQTKFHDTQHKQACRARIRITHMNRHRISSKIRKKANIGRKWRIVQNGSYLEFQA